MSSGNSGRFYDSERFPTMPLLELGPERHFQSVVSSDDEQDVFDSLLKENMRPSRRRISVFPALCFTAATALLLGFVAGYVLYLSEWGHVMSEPQSWVKEADPSISHVLLREVNTKYISQYLRLLTKEPHIAGTEQDLTQARWIENKFKSFGFDRVQMVRYHVLLSFADGKPNQLSFITAGIPELITTGKQTPLHTPEEQKYADKILSYNAYSATGTAQGNPVYVNYGREADFDYLKNHSISLAGTIVLARYGKVFRANIVKMAEERGAAGVVLFSDPADYNPGAKAPYPASANLPPNGAQSGTVMMGEGDPLTPYYPSIDSAFRLHIANASLPHIPVMPIGYDAARKILCAMKNNVPSPPEWKGGLNCSYAIGPGLQNANQELHMEVHTTNRLADTFNVIAIMNGRIEPDRYVLVGNHRDAWGFGASDPSSGTASLLELGRVFGLMKSEHGWRPRRSLVFCSWGAEEMGLIGSTEWAEDLRLTLHAQAVAYINVDQAVTGREELKIATVPLLENITFESASKVAAKEEINVTIGLSTGSDYVSFIHNLGIPSADLQYRNHDMSTTPLYHSLYETYYSMSEIIDPGFKRHQQLTQIWAELARNLADSLIIPFNAEEYGFYVGNATEHLQQEYGTHFTAHNISLAALVKAGRDFSVATVNFCTAMHSIDHSNPLAVRRVNDALMNLERAFINPLGLPMGRTEYNHVLFAPSEVDGYAASKFPGIEDLLRNLHSLSKQDEYERLEQLRKHISELTYYVLSATRVAKMSLV